MVEWNYQKDPNVQRWNAPGALDAPPVADPFQAPISRNGYGAAIPDRAGALMDQLDAETPRNPLYKSTTKVGLALDNVIVPGLAEGKMDVAVAELQKLLSEKGPPPQTPENISKYRAKLISEILTETQIVYEPEVQSQILQALKQAKVGAGDYKLQPNEKPGCPNELKFISGLKSAYDTATEDRSLMPILASIEKDISAAGGIQSGIASKEYLTDLAARLNPKNAHPISANEFIVSLLEHRQGLAQAIKEVDQGKPDDQKLINQIAAIYKAERGAKDPPADPEFQSIQKALEQAGTGKFEDLTLTALQQIVANRPSGPINAKYESFDKIPETDRLLMRILSNIDDPKLLAKCEAPVTEGIKNGHVGNIIGLYFKPEVNGHAEGQDVVKAIYCLKAVENPYDQLEALAVIKRLSDQQVGLGNKDSFEQKVLNGMVSLDPKATTLDVVAADVLSRTNIGKYPEDLKLFVEAFNSPNKRDFAALVIAQSVVRMDKNGEGVLNQNQLRDFIAAANATGRGELDRLAKAGTGAIKNHVDPNDHTKEGKTETRGDMETVLHDAKIFRSNLKIALGMTSDAFDRAFPN